VLLFVEYAERGSLHQLLANASARDLTWRWPLLSIAADVCRGGAYLHEHRVLHR